MGEVGAEEEGGQVKEAEFANAFVAKVKGWTEILRALRSSPRLVNAVGRSEYARFLLGELGREVAWLCGGTWQDKEAK